MDSMSNVADFEKLEKTVGFNTDFSFSETLGTFINNREFSQGYIDFINNRETADSYSWTCLSAIGDEIGKTVYENVVNYVDFVSNVDICKIQSLRSMMKNFGFDYTMFDDIEKVPVEIYDLMNIFSVNPKYLFDNKTFKSEYLSAAYGNFMFGEVVDSPDKLSAYLSSYEGVKLDERTIDDGKFFQFICGTYERVLSDFICLKVNSSGGDFIYNHLETGLQDELDAEEEFRKLKVQHDIPLQFDEKAVVDAIDNGTDSMDSYSYPTTLVIQKEIDRRAARASEKEASGAGQETRYTYYRKVKVGDYIRFVNDKYFLDHIGQLSGVKKYDLDETYFDLTNSDINQSGEHSQVLMESENGKTVDWVIVRSVARSLGIATMYIRKLREKLKIQTRKNYMKGTQNLLLYVINEYLIDYSRHRLMMLQENPSSLNEKETKLLTNILGKLSAHDIDDLDVIEYYDPTEYFNQSTDMSPTSMNGSLVNKNFWKNVDMTMDNGLTYKLRDIQDFYLKTMAMCDQLGDGEELADFLDMVYGIGADRSSIGKDGTFRTDLTEYGRYSSEIFPIYENLNNAWKKVQSMMTKDGYSNIQPVDFQFNENFDIETQLSDLAYNYVYVNVSNDVLAGLSSVYEEYNPQIEGLSSKFDDLVDRFNNLIGGDIDLYFTSCDSKYSIDSNGAYKHDFFTGNPEYETEFEYLKDKLFVLEQYVQKPENIVNYQLLDMITNVRNNNYQISSQYVQNILPSLESIDGYVPDDEKKDLVKILQNSRSFIDDRIEARRKILGNSVEQTKDEIETINRDCEDLYNDVQSSVTKLNTTTYMTKNSLNVTSDLLIRFYTTKGDKNKGTTRCKRYPTQPKKKPEVYYCPDVETDQWFARDKDGNYSVTSVSNPSKYDPSSGIQQRIEQLSGLVNFVTSEGSSNQRALFGIVDVDSMLTKYRSISDKVNRIVSKLKAYGQIEQDESQIVAMELNQRVSFVVDKMSTIEDLGGIFDEEIVRLNSLRTTIQQYLEDAQETETEYTKVIQSTRQVLYISQFDIQDKSLTFETLDSLENSAKIKDSQEYGKISVDVTGIMEDLQVLEDDMIRTWKLLQRHTGRKPNVQNVFEKDVAQIRTDLLNDIDNKQDKCQIEIDNRKQEFDDAVSIVRSETSSYYEEANDDIVPYSDLVERRLDYLNFFTRDQYVDKKTMFYMYTGLKNSYFPYYNLKNVTHPSYQIHPFLWNFVAKSSKYSISNISKQFNGANIEELENVKQAGVVDKYYGEYGEAIDLWVNNNLDYSGYTTRYEQSNHYSSTNTMTSEVIGYDGLFYPPAVEMFVKDADRCISSIDSLQRINLTKNAIENSISGDILDYVTTEERYLEDNTVVVKYVDGGRLYDLIGGLVKPFYNIDVDRAIDEYFNGSYDIYGNISDVDGHSLAECVMSGAKETFYGMYYRHLGLEVNEEKKKFIVDQLKEYKDRIIEVASPKDSVQDVYDIYRYGVDSSENQFVLLKRYSYENPTIKQKRNTAGELWIRLAGNPIAAPAFSGSNPNVDMQSDIHKLLSELSSTGDGSYSNFYDFDISQDGRFIFLVAESDVADEVRTYENPKIGIGWLDEMDDVGRIHLNGKDEDASSTTEIIRSGNDYLANTVLSALPDKDIRSYAFIGQYIAKANETDFVYVEKIYREGKTPLPTGNAKIVRVIDGLTTYERTITGTYASSIEKISGEDVVFAYDKTNKITFAYTTDVENGIYQSIDRSRTHVVNSASEDMWFDDQETNSFDLFTTNLRISKCEIFNGSIVRSNSESTVNNMNADMSYMPVYPGIEASADVYDMQGDKTLRIELLGRSKNIDDNIRNVNVDVDPYFDFNAISSNYIFGRVYEDVEFDKDRSLKCIKNPLINNNTNNEDVRVEDGSIVWTIRNLSEIPYEQNEIDNMKFVLYNSETLGKNAYTIGSLSSVRGEWKSVENYMEAGNDIEIRVENVDGTTTESYINATGTYDGLSSINKIDNNNLENIKDIQVYYDDETRFFKIRFVIDDLSQIGTTFIKRDLLNFVIFSEKSLGMFNFYHFLDAYGAVSLAGMTQEDLANIDFEKYSSLSDIYLLRGWRGMQFKYDEGDIFDFYDKNYYFPTLNSKYPKTFGQVFSEMNTIDSRLQHSNSIFGTDDYFVINCFDTKSLLSDLGEVDIDILRGNRNLIRVFEKYTTLENGAELSSTFGKYDTEDVRSLQNTRYSMVSEDGADCNPDEYVGDSGTIQDVYDNMLDNGISSFATRITEDGYDENYSEKVRFNLNSQNVNLDKFTRMFVNYKSSGEGIHLYFNYVNYIDTPYLKFQDGRLYSDLIDGTYLHLAPGEGGILRFVTQLKYYVNGQIAGIKNIELAALQIFNVSDDKPKFVVKYKHVASYNEGSSSNAAPIVKISIGDKTVDRNTDNKVHLTFQIRKSKPVNPGFTFGFTYPSEIITPVNRAYRGFSIDTGADGYLAVTVTDENLMIGGIDFVVSENAGEHQSNVYGMNLELLQDIEGKNEVPAIVRFFNGNLNVL